MLSFSCFSFYSSEWFPNINHFWELPKNQAVQKPSTVQISEVQELCAYTLHLGRTKEFLEEIIHLVRVNYMKNVVFQLNSSICRLIVQSNFVIKL